MFGEPFLNERNEFAVAEGIANARADVEHIWRVGSRARRGDGDDRGDDKIDRNDVDHPFGDAGELAEQAAGVRDDHRLRHPKAADPPRMGFGER